MQITFNDQKLGKLANNYKKCIRVLGLRRADLLTKRLLDLKNAESLDDVRFLPGNYHELTGNRKGQWACNLDHPYRLIFEPHEKPVPEDRNGRYIWLEIRGVEIIEIVDYH